MDYIKFIVSKQMEELKRLKTFILENKGDIKDELEIDLCDMIDRIYNELRKVSR